MLASFAGFRVGSSSVSFLALQQSTRLKALADATSNSSRPLLKDFFPQPRRV